LGIKVSFLLLLKPILKIIPIIKLAKKKPPKKTNNIFRIEIDIG